MSISEVSILQALEALCDPLTGHKLGQKLKIQDISTSWLGKIEIKLALGYRLGASKTLLEQQILNILETKLSIKPSKVNVLVDETVKKHVVKQNLTPLAQVKNIIPISSGKGGVGKSTTTVNLALALAADGASVGILDADIYGPSQPLLLGIAGQKPESKDNKSMEPLSNYGVSVNSIGFLIDDSAPVAWRGPMVSGALDQLLNQTNWPELDYLLIDMPPGTGDIALTLVQKVPVVGAVIVTTPQDIALLDAKKGLRMFQKVEVPVLGVIENMSVYCCPNCGHTEHLFGQEGGQRMAQELSVDYLGGLPLELSIREQADAGKPIVIADPQSQAAQDYAKIARNLAIAVSNLEEDTQRHFPKFMMKVTQ
ncbi:iron-sulfur cluster carrier protein ApbC [Basilea psittacipulmonis]|uniref:Iron-sulfur cluster carrier protein n=1 Tax=Basilea psittacipulmonis DSM 24701 TaxID=1072685 RepID=A0A077DG47_9BURK|nr:iron-sulfur cluster carrier protein ApbC [Basilea psittacipulmonis]AIL32447.1 ATP-binding protein [Basilea psittacipulmonis DSM 24701]